MTALQTTSKDYFIARVEALREGNSIPENLEGYSTGSLDALKALNYNLNRNKQAELDTRQP